VSVSGTVSWTVSGSVPSGSCTLTYSGSGSGPAKQNNADGTTEMSLEDVSGKADAPKPEPEPYYYSISSESDTSVSFTRHYSGAPGCSNNDSTENLGPAEFEIGYQGNFSASTPPDQVQKSATTAKLAGQLTHDDPNSGFHLNDSWSFTGSGQGP
jgi:hypothetical protein